MEDKQIALPKIWDSEYTNNYAEDSVVLPDWVTNLPKYNLKTATDLIMHSRDEEFKAIDKNILKNTLKELVSEQKSLKRNKTCLNGNAIAFNSFKISFLHYLLHDGSPYVTRSQHRIFDIENIEMLLWFNRLSLNIPDSDTIKYHTSSVLFIEPDVSKMSANKIHPNHNEDEYTGELSTGWSKLDNLMVGGLKRGQLCCVTAAQPSKLYDRKTYMLG